MLRNILAAVLGVFDFVCFLFLLLLARCVIRCSELLREGKLVDFISRSAPPFEDIFVQSIFGSNFPNFRAIRVLLRDFHVGLRVSCSEMSK